MLVTKKPITVDAVQWHRDGDHPAVLQRTIGGETELPHVVGKQGAVRVDPGDWIIPELDGSGYYPCKPDVFAAMYMPVSRSPDATGKPAITRAEADDGLSAAPAPRVTVESMEAKVASAEYFRSKTLTLCILTLANGFTIVGKSACASPENYDQAKGERYAYDDAFRQIWAFEGYLLRERLSARAAEVRGQDDAVQVA